MDRELTSMVMAFRVTELQSLLTFAGKNKTGRKNELQARCLDLVKIKSAPVSLRIKELYKSIQISNLGQPLTGNSLTTGYGTTASSLAAGRSYGSTYQSDPKSDTTFGRALSFGQSHRTITVDGQNRTVPLCPDVTMKRLPFYDIQSTLLRPTSLLSQGHSPKQETQHTFCLSPSEAGEISGSREVIQTPNDSLPISKIQYTVQVQLRFCALDSTEEQDDLFPPNVIVKVNGRPVQLPHPIPSNRPGVDPKRPSRPLNITNNVKCSPHNTNVVHVQWVADGNKNYAMAVNMVRKLTAEELLQRLKSKRIQPAEFTRGRIKEITTAEEEDLCAPTSIRVSVACPVAKSRMTYPCRATTCKHLQCFDANYFLMMNEKKPSFICPVCNKQLKFEDLNIDGYFRDVISNLSIDGGNDIELYADGSWTPAVKVKKEIEDCGPPPKRMKPNTTSTKDSLNNTIDLDDDICIVDDESANNGSAVEQSSSSSKNAASRAEPEVIDLLSSSDEEEDEEKSGRNSETSTVLVEERAESGKEHDDSSKAAEEEEEDDEEDEPPIGVRRTRRGKQRINYVEDSSSDSSTTNEGFVSAASPEPRVPKSPACIELSDSPTPSPENDEPQQQRRAFASISSSSNSTRSAAANANNRSGSGTSTTLYSSDATALATNPAVGIGTGMSHSSSATHPNYYNRAYSSSSSVTMNPASALLLPSTPGYTAYDAAARSPWDDMNNFIGMPYGYSYDSYLNQGYDPRNTGGGGFGGGYGGFM